MKFRVYGVLFLANLLALLALAAFQPHPGYMDADYYFANGLALARGNGPHEAFLWNYLDEPSGLPHPAFTYWMPLTSRLASISMRATGLQNFFGSRLIFLALAALVAPLTAHLSFVLTRRAWMAWLAGGLAVFSGYYLAFLGTTDTFGLSMLLGALWLLIAQRLLRASGEGRAVYLEAFILGILAGLMHQARADGLIWLLMSGVVLALWLRSSAKAVGKAEARGGRLLPALVAIALCGTGYLVVMGGWFIRNLQSFGSWLGPGSGRALWITRYDEIYLYPASQLTFQHWISGGLEQILAARLWALGQNLQTALAVQGLIFLGPLALLGFWILRRDTSIRLGLLAWAGIFLAFTLLFPFQGARGGFFHSGAALQPLLWSVVPVGLSAVIAWGVGRRNWRTRRSKLLFGVGLVAISAIFTAFLTHARLVGTSPPESAWGAAVQSYSELDSHLGSLGIGPGEIAMVNNPPGYWTVTGRPAIVIPDGPPQAALDAGRRYGASYLLLDANYPREMGELFANPGDRPGLDYVGTRRQVRIFRIVQ